MSDNLDDNTIGEKINAFLRVSQTHEADGRNGEQVSKAIFYEFNKDGNLLALTNYDGGGFDIDPVAATKLTVRAMKKGLNVFQIRHNAYANDAEPDFAILVAAKDSETVEKRVKKAIKGIIPKNREASVDSSFDGVVAPEL
jgi:hypothetical protein